MFPFKSGALGAGIVAALLGLGGSARAQNPPAEALPTVPAAIAPGAAAAGGPTPGAAPAPGTAPSGPGDPPVEGGKDGGGFDWRQVPRNTPFPLLGNFPVLPSGPGYYSLLDCLRGDYLEAPPKFPYPRSSITFRGFFNDDNFGFLDDPNNTEHDFFDPVKRVHIGDNWLFTTGGEFRTRYMDEHDARLTLKENSFDLNRLRVYGDLWYRDDFRIFAEYLGSWATAEALTPLATDQHKSGLQNLFVDVKWAELGGAPAYVRVGRQELLFGSQRLISTADWTNTRRTFQGVDVFDHMADWDFDAFWVKPVVPTTNRPAGRNDANTFDSVDDHQNFYGAWATNRPKAGQVIDLYYLYLQDSNVYTQAGLKEGDFNRHTFGTRYAGREGNFAFDQETAVQFGDQYKRDVLAGMNTTGIGWNFKDAAWDPTAWAYFDYASGGHPTSGVDHTFNSLFSFNHFYLGWADLVGRANIYDLNFHLYLYPTKWLTCWLQYHDFWLASKTDALYTKGGTPYIYDPTGRSGSHVGQETDFVFNFHLSKHADILTGYSYLFGGEFLKNMAAKGPTAVDSGSFYFQYSYKW